MKQKKVCFVRMPMHTDFHSPDAYLPWQVTSHAFQTKNQQKLQFSDRNTGNMISYA